eukprot:463437-Rhodomonas_salina.1
MAYVSTGHGVCQYRPCRMLVPDMAYARYRTWRRVCVGRYGSRTSQRGFSLVLAIHAPRSA